VVVAISMLVIMGFAALVIDLGAGFNERAQDQSAADASVMAGAIEVLGNAEAMRDKALEYARSNLDTTYTDAEWASTWESCSDPEKASLGLGLTPVPGPAADGNWTGVSQLDCISTGSGGFLRVRIPDQIVATTFGKTMGADQLEASAAAVSKMGPRGEGGILPFGLLATATEGELTCLRSDSGGQADPPCNGGNTGNFGAIESLFFGTNPDLSTYGDYCDAKPKKKILAYNIAAGLDHTIVIDQDGAGGSEVLDDCSAPPYFPDTLHTFQGISEGFEQGLVAGGNPLLPSEDPRLWRSPTSWEASIFGWDLDNKPLWDFIDAPASPGDFRDPGDTGFNAATDLPRSCAGFNPSGYDWDGNGGLDPSQDWDGDGTVDANESWQHMWSCLQDYVSGGYTTIMIDEDIANSSRFAYVPQFWESSWPTGNSEPRHIMAFRPVFLQTLWFGTGSGKKVSIFNPGEPCVGGDGSSCNYNTNNPGALRQLAAFFIPDGALPEDLRGQGPGGTINPYAPELYR